MIFSKDDILWQGNVKSLHHGMYLGFNSVLLISSMSYFCRIIYSNFVNIGNLIILLFLILAILFFLLYAYVLHSYIKIAFHALTIKYTVTKLGIKLKWWFLNSYHVFVPWSDIQKIDLVEYKNSIKSTIYFSTFTHYKDVSYNYDEFEERQCITFEDVDEGKLVYDLLIKLKY